MEGALSFMTIFYVLVGIFCIYSAIAGKGIAFKNEYPEHIKGQVKKLTRILLFIVGPITLFLGVSEYFQWFGTADSPENLLVQMIGVAVSFAFILAYIIYFRVKFGKELKNPKIKKIQ